MSKLLSYIYTLREKQHSADETVDMLKMSADGRLSRGSAGEKLFDQFNKHTRPDASMYVQALD